MDVPPSKKLRVVLRGRVLQPVGGLHWFVGGVVALVAYFVGKGVQGSASGGGDFSYWWLSGSDAPWLWGICLVSLLFGAFMSAALAGGRRDE